MAKIFKKTVVQDNLDDIDKRFIGQYFDDVSGENGQVITNYSDLSASEKSIYDAFQELSESKIV